MELSYFIDTVLNFDEVVQPPRFHQEDSFLEMEQNLIASQNLLQSISLNQKIQSNSNQIYDKSFKLQEIEIIEQDEQIKIPDYSLPKKSQLFKDLKKDLDLSYAEFKL